MLLNQNYQSQQPLAINPSEICNRSKVYCQWTASLDRRGLMWRGDQKVNKPGASFYCELATTCKCLPLRALCSCPAALRLLR